MKLWTNRNSHLRKQQLSSVRNRKQNPRREGSRICGRNQVNCLEATTGWMWWAIFEKLPIVDLFSHVSNESVFLRLFYLSDTNRIIYKQIIIHDPSLLSIHFLIKSVRLVNTDSIILIKCRNIDFFVHSIYVIRNFSESSPVRMIDSFVSCRHDWTLYSF